MEEKDLEMIKYRKKNIEEAELEKKILIFALINEAKKDNPDYDFITKIACKISTQQFSIDWEQERLDDVVNKKTEEKAEEKTFPTLNLDWLFGQLENKDGNRV